MRLDTFLQQVLDDGENYMVFHRGKTYPLFDEQCPSKAAFDFLKTRFQAEMKNGTKKEATHGGQ